MEAVRLTGYTHVPPSMEQLRFVFDSLRDGVFWVNPQGRVVYANMAACHALEYTCDKMLASRVHDFTVGLTEEGWNKHWQRLCERRSFLFEARCRSQNGREFPVEVSANHYLDGSEFGCYVVHDVSMRKSMEETVQLAVTIYMSSSEAVLVTDENNCIVQANPAFSHITGYDLEELLGHNPSMLQSGLHDEEHYLAMWHAIRSKGSWQGELWDRRKNGELFASWVNITRIRHEDGSTYRHVAQFTDVTEKKLQEELVWRYASYDVLTGLPNRRLFYDRLEQEIKRAGREGAVLSLMFIDLDEFKQVNDTLGHGMGDQLLVEAAKRISRCVRETDTVARLGGDEFTIILPEVANGTEIERIAQEINRVLGEPFRLGEANGKVDVSVVSGSIGIAFYPSDAADAPTLVKQADRAMYRAKSGGRNCHAYAEAIPSGG